MTQAPLASIGLRTSDLAELPAREVRADIQGLRAIAVLLVLGYHLWPDRIVGGFIGVDVFFVISGFLITGHLLRKPPRSIGDFADFWGRRLRRLLPASLLVIAFTVLIGCLVLPVTRLESLGRDAVSAALYFENWALALSSIDYLGAAATPSPLQHYWSLGVEEQFYLVWPFLIAFLMWVARRTRRSPARAAVFGLSVFVVASLVVSIVWTWVEPASAYFVTPTRLWELAAGGVVAAAFQGSNARGGRWPRGSAGGRSAIACLGLVIIFVSSFALTSSAPFPGYLALLPVAGACLVLGVNAPASGLSPTRILSWRPVQFVGDTSYAIYLWHFPLIVLAGAALGVELAFAHKAAIIAGCLVLGQLTRVFIEDPVRRSSWLRAPLARTYALAAASTVVIVVLAFLPGLQVAGAVAQDARVQQDAAKANSGCFGAQALATSGCEVHGVGVLPSPANALQDVGVAYSDNCFNEKPFAGLVTCEFGNYLDPDYRVALVGNSHAAQWLPALQELATSRNFSITVFVASGCMPTEGYVLFDTAASSEGCHAWGQRVIAATTSSEYDLVVTSVASNSDLVDIAPADKYGPQRAGYAGILSAWARAGQHVLVIRDTPIPGFNIPDCVAGNAASADACDGARSQWEQPDPMTDAVEDVDDELVQSVDLNDLLCAATECFAVVGGVMVYFDHMHVGATFIRSMSPYLAESVDKMISQVAP